MSVATDNFHLLSNSSIFVQGLLVIAKRKTFNSTPPHSTCCRYNAKVSRFSIGGTKVLLRSTEMSCDGTCCFNHRGEATAQHSMGVFCQAKQKRKSFNSRRYKNRAKVEALAKYKSPRALFMMRSEKTLREEFIWASLELFNYSIEAFQKHFHSPVWFYF